MLSQTLQKISNTAQNVMAKSRFTVKKYAPEILIGVGITSFVGTVILSCRATLHAEEILDRHKREMDSIKDAKELAEANPKKYEYENSLYIQDKGRVYVRTFVDFTKLYLPAVAMGGLSVTCLLSAHNILNKRYIGVVAAYNALATSFDAYRDRVREEHGEVMDRHYMYGTDIKEVMVETVDENGKKTKKKEYVETGLNPNINANPSDGAVFFDSRNKNFDPNPEFSLSFLRGVQSMLNDKFYCNKCMTLNEVYEALGFKPTQSGQVIGWVWGLGDNLIDFGLYNPNNQNTVDFINGRTNSLLLEFNHDGIIWDYLPDSPYVIE